MRIACAKRLMSKYPKETLIGSSDLWEFNPIHYEVLVRSHIVVVRFCTFVSSTPLTYNQIITKLYIGELYHAYFS